MTKKRELIEKGFKWFGETLYLYGRAKVQGDEKTVEHIEGEVDLIKSIVKMTLENEED